MDTKDFVTVCLGAIGLLLSCIVFYYSRKDKKRRLKVTFRALLVSDPKKNRKQKRAAEPYVVITATNVGQVDINLVDHAFVLKGRTMTLRLRLKTEDVSLPNGDTNATFPIELRPGKACQLIFAPDTFVGLLEPPEEFKIRRARLVLIDSTGTSYKCPWIHRLLDARNQDKLLLARVVEDRFPVQERTNRR